MGRLPVYGKSPHIWEAPTSGGCHCGFGLASLLSIPQLITTPLIIPPLIITNKK
jgi:hypothetical protein